jgi:hypothetical protein
VRELLKPNPPVAIDAALLPPAAPAGEAPGAAAGEGAAGPAAAAAAAAEPPPPPRPLSVARVCNQVRLAQRRAIAGYYEGRLRSDDETAPCDTRNVCLAVREDAAPGSVPPEARCTGSMRLVVSEGALYTQVGWMTLQNTQLPGCCPAAAVGEGCGGEGWPAARRRQRSCQPQPCCCCALDNPEQKTSFLQVA